MICLYHYHCSVTTTSTSDDPDSWQKTMPLVVCNDWRSRPTQYGSYIHVRHIQSDWQPSYAVDGHMDMSSLCYHHKCSTRVLAWFCQKVLSLLAPNHVVLQWLRLKTHVEWIWNPWQTFIMSLITLICIVRFHRSVITPLPIHVLVNNCMYVLWGKRKDCRIQCTRTQYFKKDTKERIDNIHIR